MRITTGVLTAFLALVVGTGCSSNPPADSSPPPASSSTDDPAPRGAEDLYHLTLKAFGNNEIKDVDRAMRKKQDRGFNNWTEKGESQDPGDGSNIVNYDCTYTGDRMFPDAPDFKSEMDKVFEKLGLHVRWTNSGKFFTATKTQQ